MKLKRILVTAFLGVLIVLTCFVSAEKDSEKLYAEMPDIVFVKFYWDYNGVITGEYIDKNGQVISFEFADMEFEPELENSALKLGEIKNIGQYSNARDIHKINELIYAHYKNDNKYVVKNISDSEMSEYYSELLRINEKFGMDTYGYTVTNDLQGLSCMYGIRNSDEIIFIREYGKYYLITAEKHTENLFYALHTVFSQMEPMINGW